jgi:predicted TIM-barrel fold metal-dependent hydrolase
MKSYVPLCFLLLLLSMVSQLSGQNVDTLKLKNYRPVSIYKTPQTKIVKGRYPVIDFHAHDDDKTPAEIEQWVKTMDSANIAKTIVLSYATGARFDSIIAKYARYNDRFEVWCGFDYTGFGQPGWSRRAVKELERCYKKGARGVGELGDKGLGELYSHPTPGYGIHIDDSHMRPLLKRCGELRMPISIHVAEDAWMYAPIDSTNDGLMNAATWRVDQTKKGLLSHDQLIATLEHAVRDNPNTTFIACHLANTCSDLSQLGKLFDKYPNLYADIAARYGELAPIPRFVRGFMEQYSNRIVYGTDMGASKDMYHTTFRILESADEHFYEHDRFGYHWPLYGLALPDAVLKKLYQENGAKILSRK